MPGPLDDLRAAAAARDARIEAAARQLAAAGRALVTASAAPAETPAARARRTRALRRESDAASTFRATLDDLDLLGGLVAVLGPDDVLGALEISVPLVLFPVRLETRFATVAGATELLVRVYPDAIHVDAHEPELTAEELADGQAFWSAGGSGNGGDQGAWAALVSRHGSERAAWIRLATAPGAPQPGLRRAPWTRPVWATGLPDRFVFLVSVGGARLAPVVGSPVRRPLPVGPDPQVQEGTGPARLDPASQWLVDFAAAESAGVAVRIPLPAGTTRVDRLLVVGLAASLGPAAAADQLNRLLAAHRFTDGLELVPVGTPTNAAGAASGYSSRESPAASFARETEDSPVIPPHDADAERVARAAATDAARVAAALGVPRAELARAAGAAATSELDARAMLAALWPGTIGYYLRQFLSGSVAPDEAELLRRHAVDFVRSRGPFATLRIGEQPYGVLPVTSLARYRPPADRLFERGRLVALLRRLDGVWARAVRGVPRVGAGDPDAAIAGILGLAPVSLELNVRRIHTSQTLGALATLGGAGRAAADGIEQLRSQLVEQGARALGRLNVRDGLLGTVADERTRRAAVPRVVDGPLSETDPLAENYLTFLRTATPDDIAGAEQRYGSPLLYLLLRYSILHQYVRSAEAEFPDRVDPTELLDRYTIVTALPGLDDPRLPLDLLRRPSGPSPVTPPVVDVLRATATGLVETSMPLLMSAGLGQPPTGMPGELGGLEGAVPGAPGGALRGGISPSASPAAGPGLSSSAVGGPGAVFSRDRGTFVSASEAGAATGGRLGTTRGQPISGPGRQPAGASALADVLAGLAQLESRPTALLDRLLRETLDLASHRLDPWITSLATERLDAMRRSSPAGAHLGAYGWLERIEAAPPPQPVPAAEHPAVARPLARRADSGGFVHAPSLSHAAAAGVLRSAHLAHGGGPELAIDLSSKRVRVALWLLEGVRAGQPLGALLGYRLERALHERGLDHVIAGLRDAAPLTRTRLAPGAPSEAVAAHDVVDGLKLVERLEAPAGSADRLTVAALAPAADRAALGEELASLADAADAVADLLLAESVHQLVSGNAARAAAAAKAAAGGEVPAELEVVRTPRGGTAVVHRVLLLAPVARASASSWKTDEAQIRALLDPELERLASGWLGPPSRVVVGIRWKDPQSGDVLAPAPGNPAAFTRVTLDALKISALDAVFTAQRLAAGSPTEIERRLVDLALRSDAGGIRPPELGSEAEVELVVDAAGSGELDLGTFLELAASLRRALGRSRSLEPADVLSAGAAESASVAVAELDGRIGTALSTARAGLLELQRVLSVADAAIELGELRAALRAVSAIGLPATWPLSADGDADRLRSALVAQGRAAATELAARIDRADAALAAAGAARELGTSAEAGARRAAAQQLFGEEAPLLAALGAAPAVALVKGFARPPAMGRATPTRSQRASLVRTYLARAAAVRRDVDALEQALALRVATGAQEPGLLVAQFAGEPVAADEQWLGYPAAPGAPAGGRISVVAVAPEGEPAAADPLVGLLVDEWTEVVPRKEELTALAVHAQLPGSEPPHAILVAVPPDPDRAWDLDTLAAVLDEVLDRAPRRMVDLPALPDLGHVLPALYVNSTERPRVVGVPFRHFVPRKLR